MPKEIKFRLIKEGGIIGFERFSPGNKFVFCGWEYQRLEVPGKWEHQLDGGYIEHDKKDQFTGLRDKHGVEIYEGDIVEMIGEYGLPYRQEVKYLDGYYIPLVKVEYGYNTIDSYDPSRFEVVGNIYENPELLK